MEHLEGPRLKKLERISPPHSNATGGDGPLRRGRGRHWLRAQHISPLRTPETGGPGSPSISVLFEELPNGCHAKQHNQHRHAAGARYVDYMPSQPLPSRRTHPCPFKSRFPDFLSFSALAPSLLSRRAFSFPPLFLSVLHVCASA